MHSSMREFTNVSSLGLSDRDKRVLASILKIVSNLHPSVNVLEPESVDDADLVFVDAEDKDALENIRSSKGNVTPIIVGDPRKHERVDIKRPLVLKRVLAAIEGICSTEASPAQETKKGPSALQHHILVVDDSFPVRKYMEQKLFELSSGAADLKFADSGSEAVKQIKAQTFDAIFLDIIMPDINGYKVCKWIKSVQPKAKVILLTGKKSPIDKVRGTMSGCDAYLTKPPSEERLKELYQELLGRTLLKQA